MVKQATNILLSSLQQIPHPEANLRKANARPLGTSIAENARQTPGGGGGGQPWN